MIGSQRDSGTYPSLIVLFHDYPEITEHCLLSIRKHVVSPYELLLVDNGSKDPEEGKMLAESYKEGGPLILHRYDDNTSYAFACNEAAMLATGDPIVFLNNDMFLGEDIIAKCKEILDNHPEVAVVAPSMVESYFSERVLCFRLGPMGEPHPVFLKRQVDPIHLISRSEYASIFMIRRSVFQKLGGFDEDYTPFQYEDTDLCFRVRKAGHKVAVRTDTRMAHQTSHTTRKIVDEATYNDIMNKNRTLFINKWGKKVPRFL